MSGVYHGWRLAAITIILFALSAALMLLVVPPGAATQDACSGSLTITEGPPWPQGDAGTVERLERVPLPDICAGISLDVTLTATNGESVHPDTNLIISSNGDSVTVFDVEAESFGTTVQAGTITAGEWLMVHVQYGADEVFSGGFVVSWQPAPIVTTTTGGTSSTSLGTTTTTSETSTSTTSPKTSSTTSTSTTTTTGPASTTTTSPSTSSTTTTMPVTPPTTTPTELPRTGTGADWLIAVAIGLLVAGGAAIVLARRTRSIR